MPRCINAGFNIRAYSNLGIVNDEVIGGKLCTRAWQRLHKVKFLLLYYWILTLHGKLFHATKKKQKKTHQMKRHKFTFWCCERVTATSAGSVTLQKRNSRCHSVPAGNLTRGHCSKGKKKKGPIRETCCTQEDGDFSRPCLRKWESHEVGNMDRIVRLW